MVCPFCLHTKTEVYNSRRTTRLNATWRRRRCRACKKEFTTREYIDAEKLFAVNIGKKSVPYQKATLFLSLLKACDHLPNPDIVFGLCETVEQRLIKQAAVHKNTVSTQEITQQALAVLKNFDTPAFIKYLTYHSSDVSTATIKKELKK